jgi:DNA-binding NarL/FixJ family response regulator
VKLLLVDQDPIFRLGLRVALQELPNLQVILEAETYTDVLRILAETTDQDVARLNLVILELGNVHSTSSQQMGLQLCQQLKTQYPNLPILLLSSLQEQGILLAAKAVGVEGYCPKGSPISELVTAIQEVIAGRSYWFGEVGREPNTKKIVSSPTSKNAKLPFAKLRNDLHVSAVSYINTALAQVTKKLQVPGLPVLDQAILAGRRRELVSARWLLNQVLASPNQNEPTAIMQDVASLKTNPVKNSTEPQIQDYPSLLSAKALQAGLFTSCIHKLQFNLLNNVTNVPLEIDILRVDKKRDLLYTILQKLVSILEDKSLSQLEHHQVFKIKNNLLLDIWQAATTEFFGKFSVVPVGESQLEIVPFLLQDAEIVRTEILNKIPLINELLSYLLFKTDLRVDNMLYIADEVEAKEQGLMILENLLIQIGNAVIQPLLNKLANVEEIKENFYNRQMLSTREIERFRNNLSWKYRMSNYITEPKAIFESRHELFVFAPRGIAKVSIYAPRNQELEQLTGIPLVITLFLEFRDAIAPRLQSLLSFFGKGVVFVLTQIIGRGLGLIGRGILQGIGNASVVEKKNKKL